MFKPQRLKNSNLNRLVQDRFRDFLFIEIWAHSNIRGEPQELFLRIFQIRLIKNLSLFRLVLTQKNILSRHPQDGIVKKPSYASVPLHQ
jgi:hypothetical protein